MAARVSFIGAGKVGCSLARYLAADPARGQKDVELAGFFSASAESARAAADFAGGRAFASVEEATREAELVFVTTPDGRIAEIAAQLAAAADASALDLAGKVFAHCSGALASDVLSPLRERGAAVCSAHPLYAVSSRFNCWRELGRAWFSLEGDEVAVRTLEALLDRTTRQPRSCKIFSPHGATTWHASPQTRRPVTTPPPSWPQTWLSASTTWQPPSLPPADLPPRTPRRPWPRSFWETPTT